MIKEELLKEFNKRIALKRDSLNKTDCPEGYAFEEYNEGWRSAFMFAKDILADVVLDNNSPTPSNLDEAAENEAQRFYPQDCFDTLAVRELGIDCFKDGFKAGAEWMAGQGYITETKVSKAPLNGPIGIYVNLHDYIGFKTDDKVIVQIRKKEEQP